LYHDSVGEEIMAFADTYDVAVDATHVFRKQLAGALHSLAVDILAESPATPDHATRLTWARDITETNEGPTTEAGRWVWLMLTNATFAASPTTADDGAVKSVASGFLPTMLARWYA
jgi:hypothetical protein